jgi:hypothetical protein
MRRNIYPFSVVSNDDHRALKWKQNVEWEWDRVTKWPMTAYLEGNPLSKGDITRDGKVVQLQHVGDAIKPLEKLFHLKE